MAEVGTIEVLGRECTLHADASGAWRIVLDKRTVGNGETLDVARVKARAEIKKMDVKVSVPFVTKAGEKGTADSLHSKTRDVLGTVGGSRERFTHSNGKVFKAEVPESVVQAYNAAEVAIQEARAEQRKIDDEWELDLIPTVRRAIEAAAEPEAVPA